ncbi:hydroxyisourate hydrolase [Nocardia thraciensis]
MTRSAITTHVLDTAAGHPARGVAVRLEARTGDGWRELGSGRTDDDGRVAVIGPERVDAGDYRLIFDAAGYFGDRDRFFPEVTVTFTVADPRQHHHVPLLLSPFAISTYRGS